MSAKIKIAFFVIVALGGLGAYNKLYQYSFDAPRVASWWLHDVIVKKEQISDREKGKRIVIISGSNGLFGFDGEFLEEKTGLPVVNLALHASLDIKFYRMLAERNVREGDIVLLPIEYNYYTLNGPYNSWFIDNMLSWGKSYLKWVDPVEYIKFMSHVELQKVSSGAMSNWYISQSKTYKGKLHSDDEILSYHADGNYYGYDFRSLDDSGGVLTPNINKSEIIPYLEEPEKNPLGLYYMKDAELTSYGLSSVADLAKSIEAMGATVLLTWPVSMKSAFFNSNDLQSAMLIERIKEEMASRGVKTYCSPWDVNIDPHNFYDTVYHLNSGGARVRSQAVYTCLKNEKFLEPSK